MISSHTELEGSTYYLQQETRSFQDIKALRLGLPLTSKSIDRAAKEGRPANATICSRQQHDLLHMAIFIFNFFWPNSFEHEMICKFWGTLYAIVTDRNLKDARVVRSPWTQPSTYIELAGYQEPLPSTQLPFPLNAITTGHFYKALSRYLLHPILDLTQVFANSTYVPDLPLEPFAEAWQDFFIAMLLCRHAKYGLAGQHVVKSANALGQGDSAAAQALRSLDIRAQEYCSPKAAMALCLNKLQKGIVGHWKDFGPLYECAVRELVGDALCVTIA